MHWGDEQYVRVYVRDTTSWKRLGWDGQCVLVQLFRRVDMAGVLDIDDLEPWEAIVLHCGAPEAAARSGIDVCLRLGVVVANGSQLAIPNFRDAQEATKSDRLRQKESRERRRLDALGKTPVALDPVTNRDTGSQDVTDCHAPSRAVTSGHSLHCTALQSTALQDAGAPPADPKPPAEKPEAYARVYRQATGNTDLHDMSPSWDRDQLAAYRQMRDWCGRDLAKLRAEFARLAAGADEWLRGQPAHIWAKRLGTAKPGPARIRPGEVTRSSSGTYADPDFF